MTAPTRQTVEILAATLMTAGTTEAAPFVVGPWVSVAALNGGQLAAFLTNTSAPGVAGQFIWQGSDKTDGTNIVEIWRGAGNTNANSTSTPAPIDLPKEISYVRLVGYGNTLQPVALRGVLFAKG